MHKAIAKVAPFFFPQFLDTKDGLQFKKSLIFNQKERAQHLPNIRSHTSNTFRSEEFWTEWDAAMENMEDTEDLEAIPEYMDTAIRPIIAHCKYKNPNSTPTIVYTVANCRQCTNPASFETDRIFITKDKQWLAKTPAETNMISS